MNESPDPLRRGPDDQPGDPQPDKRDPLAVPGDSDQPQPIGGPEPVDPNAHEQPVAPEPAYQGEVQRDLPHGYALSDIDESAKASTADTPAAAAPEMIEQKQQAPKPSRPIGVMRSYAVDALRGIAILGMCLSGIVPNGLWNGMYHGYYPRFLPAEYHHDAQPDPGATNAEALEASLDVPVVDPALTDQTAEVWPAVSDPGAFYADWPSFTWVDWVFPLFLFAMGVAIPLAYYGRRAKGASWWAYPFSTVWRFVVLIGFAIYVRQVTPYFIDNPPTFGTWCLGLIAFLIPFAVFARIPKGATYGAWINLRLLGVGAAIALLAYINGRPGHSFSWGNYDIIILLLAWASLATSLIWYLARAIPGLTLIIGLPFAFIAHHQSMKAEWRIFSPSPDGVANNIGDRINTLVEPIWSAPWLDLRWLNNHIPGKLPDALLDLSPLYNFGYFKFVWITVAGTIIGDIIISRARKAANEPEETVERWGYSRITAISILMLLTIIGTFVGLKDYATPFVDLGFISIDTPYASLLVLFPLALTIFLVQPATDLWDRHVRVLTWWGSAWLVIGLLLAIVPSGVETMRFAFLEGGVSKGPPSTLSWYCLSLGLGILLVAWWTMWVDAREIRWPLGLLIANGQNPMLAYIAIRNLLAPLVALPLLAPFISDPNLQSLNAWANDYFTPGGPWSLFLWALAQTLALAIVVWAFTRARLIWRS
ncbi:MAG: DUF5009 domain-containing protein [Phycisphaeraceae bacterium]